MVAGMRAARIVALAGILSLSAVTAMADPEICTYPTYTWNVFEKRAVNRKVIKHAYASIEPAEMDAETGCSVCEEDQEEITIAGLRPFRICKILAQDLRAALERLIADGEPIFKVVGYRVGMTKGEIDKYGNRTQFSHHSFGIAVDINDEQNGLYDNCFVFGPQCRLRRGGNWDPEVVGSLTRESEIVKALKEIGLKWGGEIEGRQKDFMHFSPTGY